jgi:F-type H+/Na+-transporting ATPase subunit alpha
MLNRGARLVELLKQPQYSPLPVEKQVAIMYAGTQGMLDQVDVQDVRQYETEFHRFMETRFANLLTSIREKKTLDDEAKKALGAAVKEFNEQFTASRAAGTRT